MGKGTKEHDFGTIFLPLNFETLGNIEVDFSIIVKKCYETVGNTFEALLLFN